MKTALVIHPYLSVYAGGEVVCLHVINALVKAGYKVNLFSDVADVEEAEKFYPEVGNALGKAYHVRLPIDRKITMLPGMRMINMAQSERVIYKMLEDLDPDVTFSTQSSIFTMKPSTKLIHFTYDYNDLFVFSPFTRMKDWKPNLERMRFHTFRAYTESRRLMRNSMRKIFGIHHPEPDLICTPSSTILRILCENGYHNSCTFIPPARTFSPRSKKRQIIQVARIVQAKRLETYFNVARKMPDEKFILIARLQEGAIDYGKRLLTKLPENMLFLEGNLKNHIHHLQESSVYCYTGRDRAIMLTVAEAISAGCYPIVARDSSALDVANITKIGTSFYGTNELARLLKDRLDNPMNPHMIAKYAEPFKPEHFEDWIAKVAET